MTGIIAQFHLSNYLLNMRKILTIILLIASGFYSEYQCQDNNQTKNDSLLMSFVYIKGGDVHVGVIQEQNDSIILIDDQFMGLVSLPTKRVHRVEHLYQNTGVIITLGENLQYRGTLMRVDEEYYTLKNEHAPEFKIPRNNIVEIEILEIYGTQSSNPNATRYFFAPSAIPLEKGKGYYHNAYLLSNSANFGVTKNFSFGGGIVIPLVFYATPKIGFEVRKNLYLGAGVIAATTIIPDALISGGIPFGLITVGNMENNITLGAGYGFIWNDGEYQQTDKPIATLNGMVRLSNRIQLVSENWMIPFIKENEIDNSYITDDGFWIEAYTVTKTKEVALAFTLGTRIILNKRSSLDIAPLLLTGTNMNGIVVPYLDFVYKF